MKDLQLIFNIFDEIKKELLLHLNFESSFSLDIKKGVIENKLEHILVWITRQLAETNKLEYKDLEDLHQNLLDMSKQSIESKLINEESINQGYCDDIISIYERIDRVIMKYKKRFPKEESIKKVYHCEVVKYVFKNGEEAREHIKKMKQEGWYFKSRYLHTISETNQQETWITYERRITEE